MQRKTCRAIVDGFRARGVPRQHIRPGRNILPADRWHELGREILPGARGVVAPVIAQVDRDVKTTETETETRLYIRTVKLEFFHEVQTAPVEPAPEQEQPAKITATAKTVRIAPF